MKLKKIRTFIVGNPPPHFGGRYWIFVKLITDKDIVGYGEVYSVPFHPNVVSKMIEDVFERYVKDKNPFNIEKLWRTVYSSGYTQRPDISLLGIISGIEMACWDIIGKELNKPIYELLGGLVNNKLRTYTYLYPKKSDKLDVYKNANLAAERANEYIEKGFTAVKFDPVGPYTPLDPRQLSLEELIKIENFVKTIHDSIKNKSDILIGTHGQMTTSSAIRLAKRLEKFDPMWFEEPIPPENFEEMGKVALSTTIPIATGERLTTKYEFSKILESKGASILQMNLGRAGGILEAKKIAGLAETHYAHIAPHLYCGPIVGAANIQISTCSPNFLILEGIKDWKGFYSEIVKDPIEWKKGYVIPPIKPGLGVELREEILDKYKYSGTKLHLEMANI